MANEKFTEVGTNIQEKATVIWNVANHLFGYFKPHEYGLVILPMTVVKRFHDCLLHTHQQVLDTYEKVKKLAVIDGFLRKASGYQFYNTSKFTFDRLLADPENIENNFRDYLNGFSPNVQDVLAKFDFETIIKRMVECGSLYLIIKEFSSEKGYLGPDKISAVDCGYIFEDLVRRFSESFGEEAGAHFTSRDIIYLMTDILLSGEDLSRQENITVYDMTMGTSQMLSCMEERIHAINPEMEVTCFGQEFNPSTFAIAKADMMIRGGNPDNMRFGDTLSDDKFPDYRFRYIISNPPFGIDWKREQKAVEQEAAKGEEGRFSSGLPKISDGQQLFVLNGLKKLDNKGKMAIIQNGSPLFAGDAGSGPSNIRQYILENDWLSAIIQLSTDMFMNTGISTYIWVLDKDKPAERAGKVQLIDASHCYTPRRKSIGTKRNDIGDADRALITQAYTAFAEGVFGDKEGTYCECRIFDTDEFGYNKIVVERPLRMKYKVTEETQVATLKAVNRFLQNQKNTVLHDTVFSNMINAANIYKLLELDDMDNISRDALVKVCKGFAILDDLKGRTYMSFSALEADFENSFHNDGKKKLKLDSFQKVIAYPGCSSEKSAEAEICRDKKGQPIPDPDLRDTENVPLTEDIDAYFAREVLPYAPDAWIDRSKTKLGYEIPMTRYFYEYQKPEASEEILKRIIGLEDDIAASLRSIFGEG